MLFPGTGSLGELAGDGDAAAPGVRKGPATPGFAYMMAVLPEGVLTRTGTIPGVGVEAIVPCT